jgi:hypothetical protein
MSCSGSHLGITINIKNTKFVKDLPKIDAMGKMFQNASSLKPLGQLKPNCPGMIIGRSSTNILFFMTIGNPRWPPPQDIEIIFVVSEKKAFEHFLIGSNVNLCVAVAAILNFRSA